MVEDQLLAEFRGQPADFGVAIFRHYRRELHRYLIRRLRKQEDVDDLAQEVYLRLLRHDDSKVVRRPLAYLYGIASHVVADYRLQEQRVLQHLTFECDAEYEWTESPSTVVVDDLSDRLNLQQQLNRALALLAPTHAAVLIAHKRDGLSYDEVAEKLGLSIHTVEKYVTQAKATIRMMHWER